MVLLGIILFAILVRGLNRRCAEINIILTEGYILLKGTLVDKIY